jgi:triosephosphate isomerase
MEHIYLNLKRFDIPQQYGGVNSLATPMEWGTYIVETTQHRLKEFSNTEFTMFFPEAHVMSAIEALCEDSPVRIGAQSVYRDDTSPGGNIGAFTSNRTANSMRALGCNNVIIGHCEERNDLHGILAEADVTNSNAINNILNKEIKCAVKAGLSVLYCIGEKADEQDRWQEVLREQIEVGLKDVDTTKLVIGYEPVWSIGPGKVPADRDYIRKIARFVKKVSGDLDVVYGGGLKKENAAMLASIDEINGGLIALTRFSGEIGFYPDEFIEIVSTYLGDRK